MLSRLVFAASVTAFFIFNPGTDQPYASAKDGKVSQPSCCTMSAVCCMISQSCCPDALGKPQAAGPAGADAVHDVSRPALAQPACCLKNTHCCQMRLACCRNAVERPPGKPTETESFFLRASAAVARPICCDKRAYCCSQKAVCCR